jgi:hypothetical protein
MQQKALPKCVVLQTIDGEHLGFMLIAIADEASSGECVFIVVPRKPALHESTVARALVARKEVGESHVAVSRGESLTIHVSSPNLPDLMVKFGGAGTGSWREAAPGTASGLAVAATAV